MSVNKIKGVPEGWELVRIGTPAEGEWYIHPGGGVDVCKPDRFWDRFGKNYAIVRKIEQPPKPTYIPWTLMRAGWMRNRLKKDGQRNQ